MSEEDWRWFQLSLAARKLSDGEIESIEEHLKLDPADIDARVQVLAYYGQYSGNVLKHRNAHQKLFEQVLWFIENKPAIGAHVGHSISSKGHCFKPGDFAKLREAWLEQVSAAPSDATILGNAAKFIAWNDITTAANLFERAAEIQPGQGWLGSYLMHCGAELLTSPPSYANGIRNRIIDVGLRSLEDEPGMALFRCHTICEAALHLRRFDVVRLCAGVLREESPQVANAYLGLVALRENNRALAVQLMLDKKRGYQPEVIGFQLAGELFDAGERKSIVQFIKSLGRKIRTSARKRWLQQIADEQRPDFDDYCCCQTCVSREREAKAAARSRSK